MDSSHLVSCSKEDFLTTDQPIRGQNYTLISFLSPEDILKKKEVFMLSEYIRSFSTSLKVLIDGLRHKYTDDSDAFNVIEDNYKFMFDEDRLQDEYRSFCKSNEPLEDKFFKSNNFRTSVRGIKIRGCFDTVDEAKHRSEIIKASDPNHNIYVAEVGTWIPWDPNPDSIGNAEYAEAELNTLMKRYQENLQSKDELYLARKEDLRVAATKKNITIETTETTETTETPVETTETPVETM